VPTRPDGSSTENLGELLDEKYSSVYSVLVTQTQTPDLDLGTSLINAEPATWPRLQLGRGRAPHALALSRVGRLLYYTSRRHEDPVSVAISAWSHGVISAADVAAVKAAVA